MENFKFDAKTLAPIIVVVLIVAAVAGFFYFKSQNNTSNPAGAQQNAQQSAEEAKKLVAEISKIMDLPQDEEPTVATVSDISKLQDQPFFQKAKNGDKVLIYANAKRAILYDPVAKKILDIGFLNFTASEGGVATPSATPK